MLKKYPSPGRLKTREAFDEHLRSLDSEFTCPEPADEPDPLAQPVEVHGRTLANRFAVHPMEGWDGTPEGLPTEHTLRRWRRFGASGASLIWGGEAFAVRRDGRANPAQLFLNPDAATADGLRALLDALRAGHASIDENPDRLFVGLQLTHSGRFARPDEAGAAPRLAHRNPALASKFGHRADLPLLTDGELEAIGNRFVEAARLAQQVGFDFVDVKCCHGYLLHELLAAHTREGDYGGSFENRTRLLRRIVDGIRVACPGLEIGVRLSVTDIFPFSAGPDSVGAPSGLTDHLPYRYGFGVDADHPLEPLLDEPFRLLALLETLGIRLVNVTIGSPYYCPHLQRPAAYPPSDGYLPPEDPLLGVIRHLRTVRACKAAFPNLLFVGSGYSYLQEYLPNVARAEVAGGHVDFIGLGRMILSYPDLPRDVLAGRPMNHRRICRTFSDCTTAPRHGLISGCYPLDAHYGELPQAVTLKGIKKARRDPARRRIATPPEQ